MNRGLVSRFFFLSSTAGSPCGCIKASDMKEMSCMAYFKRSSYKQAFVRVLS